MKFKIKKNALPQLHQVLYQLRPRLYKELQAYFVAICLWPQCFNTGMSLSSRVEIKCNDNR